MGTNYYLMQSKINPNDQMHIGKSSYGWCFSLHVYPDMGINDLNDWLPLFKKHKIQNEYGDVVSYKKMQEVIVDRSHSKDWNSEWWKCTINNKPMYINEQDFHNKNETLRGPKNLLRHRINQYCIKHGTGTWDCIVGDFS